MPSNRIALLLLLSVVLSAAVKRPLVFESNLGQTDPAVRFLARGGGLTTFLTGDGAVLRLDSGRSVVLRMAGANAAARVRGVRPLRARTSYFHGSSPKAWHSGIANYGGVEYSGIYRGIDLVYYAQERRVEFDFVVRPGADASRIRVDIDGSDAAEIGGDGAVAIRVGSETVSLKAPRAYQGVGAGRREVPARFVRRGPKSIGIEVARYDRTQPLTIDPEIVYATYLGGSGTDKINAIATDPAGNVYVTGVTMSADFPSARSFASPLNRPVQLLRSEAFVAKLSAGGSELEYAAYLGGSGDDGGTAIKVDANGFAHMGGTTKSINFPTTSGAYLPKKTLPEEVFVTKLDPSGTSLVYSTLAGVPPVQVYSSYGLPPDPGTVNMAVDAGGSVFLAGAIGSTGLTPTLGAYQHDAKGESDGFVIRLNPAGSAAIYATRLGGSRFERILGIAVDADSNAYVAGSTDSSDFPLTGGLGIPMPPPAGYSYAPQIFLAKLNPTGSSLVYSTLIAGSDGWASPDAMALDSARSVYVAGTVDRSTTFPIMNPIGGTGTVTIDPNSSNAFLAKLDPSGASLQSSWWLAGAGVGRPTAMAVDSANRLHILTTTLQGQAFQPTPGAFPPADTYAGTALLVLDASGSQVAYATKVPSAYPLAMALDSESNVYFAGASVASDFKPTPGAAQPLPGGPAGQEAFIMKIAPTNPKPELTSIEPQVLFSTLNLSSSYYSALLTLNGAGFAAGSTVYWNSTPVPSRVVSDRRIDVTLTQDLIKAAVVPISVSVPEPGGGRSNAVPLHIVNPSPSYVNLSPFTAPAGSGETFVTIRGTVLPDSVVRWNGVERPVRYVPPGYLELKVPATDLAAPGFAEVTVTNPQPGGGTSPPARFIITPASGSATPIVSTSRSPVLFANSAATTIDIAGSNFDSTTVAKWNGQARPTEFVDASNIRVSLTAEDLSRADTVDITVANGSLESNVFKAFVMLPVYAKALAYDAVRKKLYASIPGGTGSKSNAIAVVDAPSGRTETFVPVGKNPGALALSGSGKFLYVVVADEGVVKRIDLQTGAVDLTLPKPDAPEGYGFMPSRLRSIPGTADSIVVGYDRGVQIFDGGVPRPNAQLWFSYTPFGSLRYVTPRHIYVGQQYGDTLPVFYRLGYDLFGTTDYESYVPASDPEARDFRYDNGLVYFTDGSKVEPISFAALPKNDTYQPSQQISADLGTRTAYALLSGYSLVFQVWDLDQLVLKASMDAPANSGTEMVRLDDGLFAYSSYAGLVFLRAPK